MKTPERVHLLPLLAQRRATIATRWQRAIARTGYVSLSPTQARQRLGELVDQLSALLCADRLDRSAAQAVGGALARLYYGHPEALSRTQEVLGHELLTDLPTEQSTALQPHLLALLSELAAGFLGQAREIVLTEQESIRNALLTARQQTEDALRQSEARFRALFDEAAIGIGIGDLEGRILETNRALQDLLGYSAEEMRRHLVAQFMHPDDLQAVWALYQELVTGQRGYFQLEKPFYRQDGQSVWTRLTVSLVCDTNGHPQLQIAMLENITERKQAEETIKSLNADLERRVLERTAQLSALNQDLADEIARRSAVEAERLQLLARAQAARAEAEAAEKRLAFLAEASSVLASSLDYKTTLISVARLAVPQLADWCAVDVVGEAGVIQRLAVAHVDLAKVEAVRALEGHYPPHPDALSGVVPVLETGQPEFLPEIPDTLRMAVARDARSQALLHELEPRARITMPLRTRERTLGTVTFVVGPGRHYSPDDFALAQDLARRAALAMENARLYREAQEALAARDEFLSVAAHELKTPVTSVLAGAQLLVRRLDKEGTVSPERLRQRLQTIERQSAKLGHLISQLLDVSRIEAGRLSLELTTTDLVSLVAGVARTLQATTSRHQIGVQAPPSLWVQVDPLRLEQVLINLLDNAIKYSPEGGDIDIAVTRPSPDTVQLSVRDRGPGITPEHRPHIFDRFYQVQAGSHLTGLGIGLYISRQIVELHGGRIEVELPTEGGTCFVVILPADPPTPADE